MCSTEGVRARAEWSPERFTLLKTLTIRRLIFMKKPHLSSVRPQKSEETHHVLAHSFQGLHTRATGSPGNRLATDLSWGWMSLSGELEASSRLSPSTKEAFSMLRTVLPQAEEERGEQGCVIAPLGHLFIWHPTAKGKQPHLFLSWESITKVPWSSKASWG